MQSCQMSLFDSSFCFLSSSFCAAVQRARNLGKARMKRRTRWLLAFFPTGLAETVVRILVVFIQSLFVCTYIHCNCYKHVHVQDMKEKQKVKCNVLTQYRGTWYLTTDDFLSKRSPKVLCVPSDFCVSLARISSVRLVRPIQ